MYNSFPQSSFPRQKHFFPLCPDLKQYMYIYNGLWNCWSVHHSYTQDIYYIFNLALHCRWDILCRFVEHTHVYTFIYYNISSSRQWNFNFFFSQYQTISHSISKIPFVFKLLVSAKTNPYYIVSHRGYTQIIIWVCT